MMRMTNYKSYFSDYLIQSEESTDAIPDESSSLEEKVEVVSFLDNAPSDVLLASDGSNPIALVDKTPDTSLGRFLARPTLVETITWSTSDTSGVLDSFYPWQVFLNNTVIRKKIDNYAFIRGKLHLKYVINGTPFQYGLIRACYSPLLNLVSDKIRTPPFNPTAVLIPYSQQPGAWISPQANSGAELTLPFFYPKNWLELGSSTDLNRMGAINTVVFAPLRVASASGLTSVTIRAYAWMTDVELMGSTLGLAVQGDEYGEGPVSRPATALASFAATLTKIPFIGSFARATEIGAGAVSQIASLFGYTNVQVIDNVHGFQPMNAPFLATTEIGTPVQKLSVDSKQELSIDPSLHGLGPQDELSINYLKQKESYFGVGTWATTDAYGTKLFNVRVTPCLYDTSDINNTVSTKVGTRVYHTPLSYIGDLFRHWRGDIIIRIKVVASKFHKGRLKISYDPRYDITTTDPGENAVYTQIIDIGEKDDFEITIPYHQATAWLRVDNTDWSNNWSTAATRAPRQYFDNGVLSVRVLTTLQAPISSSVSLLFFVKAGKSFEFAEPTNMPNGNRNQIPSFFALQGEDKVDIETSTILMGEETQSHDQRYHQNFGESVVSLRKLMHRYNVLAFETVKTEDPANYHTTLSKIVDRMPYTPGFTPISMTGTSVNKIVAASGTAPFVYESMHILPYVTNMFLGYRGSINYAFTPNSTKMSSMGPFTIQKLNYLSGLNHSLLANGVSVTATTAYYRNYLRSYYPENGLGGMAITSTNTNGSLVVTLPDYNNFNFALADPQAWNGVNVYDGQYDRQFKIHAQVTPSSTDYVTLQTAAAAGPDFTCHFFLCCPTVDYISASLTPT